MSWAEIKEKYASLRQTLDAGEPLTRAWAAFRATVLETQNAPPYHLIQLLRIVEEVVQKTPGGRPAILDHGCGGGLTLLYLLALGYEKILGVDVADSTCEAWNRLLREQFGINEKRFHAYDEQELPLRDQCIDIVFSQEVLEHVHPSAIEAYYAEEKRVLKPGGAAFHQVPHRLIPYDSHTRTWFVHYLPPRISRWVHRRLGSNMEFIENHLFLRWPGFHRRQAQRHFGDCRDVTLDRLSHRTVFDYYDGPVKLRRFIGALVRAPVLGRMIGSVAKNFVMIGTLSFKKR